MTVANSVEATFLLGPFGCMLTRDPSDKTEVTATFIAALPGELTCFAGSEIRTGSRVDFTLVIVRGSEYMNHGKRRRLFGHVAGLAILNG
jgi:hypothetical protein